MSPIFMSVKRSSHQRVDLELRAQKRRRGGKVIALADRGVHE
jgi:hypothetical protein